MRLKRSNSAAKTEDTGSAQDFKIICPKCNTQIPLTEAIAQPLIQAEVERVRQEAAEISAALRAREEELARRLESIDQVEVQLNDRAKQLEGAVQERLRTEREAIVKATEKKAAEASAARIEAAEQELAEEREKVAKAEQSELALRKERRLLEEQKRKIELEVERTLEQERVRIREDTLREEGETHQLKVAE